ESDVEVRKRLQRLTAWSRTVPYQFNPLLLRLHADYKRGNLTAEQVKDIIMKSVVKPDHIVRVKEDGKIRDVKMSDICVSGGVVNTYNALKLAATY
ncbi:MAG: hypothetical protein KGM98_02055, partial [Bacteroidota bacterium]|nr:hypothetical protein [Bacteroidota bacterium]